LARYTDAVCRLCRREGMKLFLKGAKCFSDKCPIEKRNFAPGQHGKDRKAKIVGYGLQLREKQKAKRIYFTQEGQFRNYFERAFRARASPANCCCSNSSAGWTTWCIRLGFAQSRRQARQLVRHGHVTVGKSQGQHSFVSGQRRRRDRDPREAARSSPCSRLAKEFASHGTPRRGWKWIAMQYKGACCAAEARRYQLPVNEQLIVELYSK
jgi:small subunit ribosomal protein S4